MTVFKADTGKKCPTVVSGDGCFGYAYNSDYIKAFTDNGINFVIFNRTELFPDIARYNTAYLMKDTKEYELACDTISDYEKG